MAQNQKHWVTYLVVLTFSRKPPNIYMKGNEAISRATASLSVAPVVKRSFHVVSTSDNAKCIYYIFAINPRITSRMRWTSCTAGFKITLECLPSKKIKFKYNKNKTLYSRAPARTCRTGCMNKYHLWAALVLQSIRQLEVGIWFGDGRYGMMKYRSVFQRLYDVAGCCSSILTQWPEI